MQDTHSLVHRELSILSVVVCTLCNELPSSPPAAVGIRAVKGFRLRWKVVSDQRSGFPLFPTTSRYYSSKMYESESEDCIISRDVLTQHCSPWFPVVEGGHIKSLRF